jgi:hypothetical protein
VHSRDGHHSAIERPPHNPRRQHRKGEPIMRIALIAMLALAAIIATEVPGFACPSGYSACGTRSCCPR